MPCMVLVVCMVGTLTYIWTSIQGLYERTNSVGHFYPVLGVFLSLSHAICAWRQPKDHLCEAAENKKVFLPQVEDKYKDQQSRKLSPISNEVKYGQSLWCDSLESTYIVSYRDVMQQYFVCRKSGGDFVAGDKLLLNNQMKWQFWRNYALKTGGKSSGCIKVWEKWTNTNVQRETNRSRIESVQISAACPWGRRQHQACAVSSFYQLTF